MDYLTYQRAKWETAQRGTGRQIYAEPLGSISMSNFLEDMQLYTDDLRRNWVKSIYSAKEWHAMFGTLAEINAAVAGTAQAAASKSTTPSSVKKDLYASRNRLYSAMNKVTALWQKHRVAVNANEMISEPAMRDAVIGTLNQARYTFETVKYIESIKPWFLDNRIADKVLGGIDTLVSICKTIKEWEPPSFSLPSFGAFGDLMKWSMYGGAALLLWWVLKKKKGA
ncbi:MAG: hypothetical protein KJO40_13580 [Deltaproteobacteria bacterium]|nr:hypothetical protein [Deltaproteobacteria bacterium]